MNSREGSNRMPQLYSGEHTLDEQWTVDGRLFGNDSEAEDFTARASETHGAEYRGTAFLGQYNIVQFDEFRFSQLVKSWHSERGITSSVSDMVTCLSYLRIIGMGEAALPLILAQLEREDDDPDHWFTALEAITGEDPVSGESCGDTVSMAQDWLSWAKSNNVW